MKYIVLLCYFLLLAQPALAFDKLFAKYARESKVSADIAKAIARQESALNPFCINVEGQDYWPKTRKEAEKIIQAAETGNKSYDVGIMQINSRWIHGWKMDPASFLDPEINIKMGCRILAEAVDRHGMNWKAVGAYHSPDPDRAMRYAQQVQDRMNGKIPLTEADYRVLPPRLKTLLDKKIVTRAEVRSLLANPRMRGYWLKQKKVKHHSYKLKYIDRKNDAANNRD